MKVLTFSSHERLTRATDLLLIENIPFKTKVAVTPKNNLLCVLRIFANHIPKNPNLN